MRNGLIGAVIALFVACFVPMATAGDLGTPEEAKAMAERAAEVIRSKGAAAAFAEFDAPGNQFHDRDLYVFAMTLDGVNRYHGVKKALEGRNLLSLKDVDGKSFVQDMVAVKDAGWVDYKWQNPKTKVVEQKTSYMVRVGDYMVGVGAYKR